MKNPNYWTDLLIFGQAKKEIWNEEEDEQLRREHEKNLQEKNQCSLLFYDGTRCPKEKHAFFLGCSAFHGAKIADHLTALKEFVFSADDPRSQAWRNDLTIAQAEGYFNLRLIN